MGPQGRHRLSGASRGAPVSLTEATERRDNTAGSCRAEAMYRLTFLSRLLAASITGTSPMSHLSLDSWTPSSPNEGSYLNACMTNISQA